MPLDADVLAILERRAAERVDLAVPFVFTNQGKRLGRFRKTWQRAVAAAGLGSALVHDLRRSAARNGVRAGISEHVVMDLGGWKTRSVFDRYNVTSEADLQDAQRKMSAYVAARATGRPKVRPLRGSATEQPQSARSRRPATAKAELTP